MFEHLVRVGCLGHVGRFSSLEPRMFARGTRVVCRTSRGLEVGEILSPVERPVAASSRDARQATPACATPTSATAASQGTALERDETFERAGKLAQVYTSGDDPGNPAEESGDALGDDRADGQIVRRVTVEDDLLLARLARHARSAYDACSRLLRERGLSDLLVDVEHLLDGQSLYFYFLGGPSPEVERLTQELAATYEAQAQIGKFAAAMATGCGPDCGTESATGCGSGGCSTCAIAAACGK